jgi:hypothetical protein
MTLCRDTLESAQAPAQPLLPARLGRNHGGYHGEGIDIVSVLRDDLDAARQHGWSVSTLVPDLRAPVYAFTRVTGRAPRRLYLSTGIHGDEPAGPMAIRRLLQENLWPHDADLWVMPCLNPEGFVLRRRTNGEGVDLNRDYRHLRSRTVHAHVQWLRSQPQFDFAVCLHEDWEAHGFYLYELNPDHQPTLADRAIAAVAHDCPIDRSTTIDGWPADGGIIRPQVNPADRPEWPEAIHLIEHHTRHSYTLEAPSDFELNVRIRALVAGVRALLLSPRGDGVDYPSHFAVT